MEQAQTSSGGILCYPAPGQSGRHAASSRYRCHGSVRDGYASIGEDAGLARRTMSLCRSWTCFVGECRQIKNGAQGRWTFRRAGTQPLAS